MSVFSWIHWPHHQFLLECLSQGGEARFVGGAVRNTLLGLEPDDFDLASTHSPQQAMTLLQNKGISVIPTGMAHGTVTAIVQGRPYEITTLREDIDTDGRHARVAYTASWEKDAQRRDFTINALYVDAQGILYDYCGGTHDISRGLLRFIGNPRHRIQEDYLRILRLFRFWAHYGKTVDSESLSAAIHLKAHLAELSKERITKEWIKLLTASNPWSVLDVLWKNDFFPFVMGPQPAYQDVPFFHFFQHLEKSAGMRPCPWARLLSLGANWPQDVKTLVSPLRLSRREEMILKDLNCYITPHQLAHSVYDTSVETTQYRVILSASRDQWMPSEDSFWTREIVDQSLEWLRTRIFPPFPVTGGDLVLMGITGPSVGILLKEIKNWWLTQDLRPTKKECLDKARHILGVNPHRVH